MKRITQDQIDRMRANGYDPSTIELAETWLRYCHRADALIDQVTEAFAGVELEDGIGLREATGIDDYAGAEELQRLRAADEKHDWRRISSDLLSECYSAPSFLDAKGMRFHAPAFLVAELKGEFEQGFISGFVHETYGATDFPELLVSAQREAIIACIRLYGEMMQVAIPGAYLDDDIDRAVHHFTLPASEQSSGAD